MNYNDIFNQSNLNIFTDASVVIMKNSMISCPGALVTINDKEIEYQNFIVYNSTNNIGEIMAIKLGVQLALKYRNSVKQINLFSDSNICIQGLTNWIFNWYKNRENNTLKNYANQDVKNQEHFKGVINDIVNNNLRINLYHQKGHVNNNKQILYAIKDFKRSNNIDIDYNTIKRLSYYNNVVDIRTKNELRDIVLNHLNKKISNNVEIIDDTKLYKYKQLIKR